MRILFVLENYYPHIGGVEVVFKNLAETLAAAGHKIVVVTHRVKDSKKSEKINGVIVYRVDCFHSRYWFSLLSIPIVLRLAKSADIIHTTTFNGTVPAWIGAKIRGIPVLVTVHEVWIDMWDKLSDIPTHEKFFHNLAEKMIYMLPFDKYAGVSNSTRKQIILAGVRKSKVVTVYNGVDYKHLNPGKYNGTRLREKLGLKRKWVCIAYGRPGVSKGFEYLIDAVPKIVEEIPQFKLLLILSRDKAYSKKYDELVKKVEDLSILRYVIFHEPVAWKKLPEYLAMSDCVCVPSLSEGFGYTVAEAVAMNKSIVATNTTSIPEVISGSYVMVKPKSSRALADGIKKAFLRKTAISKKKMFTIKDNVENYMEIYKELVAAKNKDFR